MSRRHISTPPPLLGPEVKRSGAARGGSPLLSIPPRIAKRAEPTARRYASPTSLPGRTRPAARRADNASRTPAPIPRRTEPEARPATTGRDDDSCEPYERREKKGNFTRNFLIAVAAAAALWAFTEYHKKQKPIPPMHRMEVPSTNYENRYLLRGLERQRERTDELERKLNAIQSKGQTPAQQPKTEQPPIIYLQEQPRAVQTSPLPPPDIYICPECGAEPAAKKAPKKRKGIFNRIIHPLVHPFSKLHIPHIH